MSGKKRLALPNANGGASAKAAGLNHPLIRCLVDPLVALLIPVEFGLCPPPCDAVVLLRETTAIGDPAYSDPIPFTLHPPTTRFTTPP